MLGLYTIAVAAAEQDEAAIPAKMGSVTSVGNGPAGSPQLEIDSTLPAPLKGELRALDSELSSAVEERAQLERVRMSNASTSPAMPSPFALVRARARSARPLTLVSLLTPLVNRLASALTGAGQLEKGRARPEDLATLCPCHRVLDVVTGALQPPHGGTAG